MAERDPIDLIKDQLNRLEEITTLHPDHEHFKQWHADTRTILEKVFSTRSTYCQNFMALRFKELTTKAFASPEIDKINAARYKRDLESAKLVLQSALKELNVDRTLFKKIQTTPKTVEVSLKGEYFLSSGIVDTDIRNAIQSAFEGSGFKPIWGAGSLENRIAQIRRAKFGIFPFPDTGTGDVFLELGVAFGLEKEVVIIFKKGISLPENLRGRSNIEYENLSELTDKLRKVN